MDGKIDEVIKQYELHLIGKRRIRGGLLLETKEGNYTLTGYRENTARVDFDEEVKALLQEKGYDLVDRGKRNVAGEWLTKDRLGNFWHMKKWYAGRECNLAVEEEVCQSVSHLACLHTMLVLPENYKSELLAASVETKKPFKAVLEKDMGELFWRHSREMRRSYNYIKRKKKKNEMEIYILNLFPDFSSQAEAAEEVLKKVDCKKLLKHQIESGRILHGSYNYHNILFQEKEQIVTTNFEKSAYGMQIMDLYVFLRKLLEKNNWDIRQGLCALDAYRKKRELAWEEGVLLYALFLFPEKFWKQVNFYYNGKKTWMSGRNLDKIKQIEYQETERRKFLEELKKVLI